MYVEKCTYRKMARNFFEDLDASWSFDILYAQHSNKQMNYLFSEQRGQEVMDLNWSREQLGKTAGKIF